jgi:oligopeptide/dipeptide ABC transporter ATP-binding protein
MTALLDVSCVSVQFPGRDAPIRAVDGVTLDVREGETLALVGESGCGKSTLARAIVGLVSPSSGTIRYRGEVVHRLGHPARRRLSTKLQMVFQDPDASLNPRLTIAESLGEPLELSRAGMRRDERDDAVSALLRDVGMDPALRRRYPHELSGGQRQRVCIARALAVRPELVVCDEAVSALDVSVQAQILNLLVDLRERFGLAYLFITHDLRVVRHVSHRVAVMYLGQIVETGPTEAVFESPAHPYTRALLAAVPGLGGKRPVARARGEIPSPSNPPSGCRFHTRCPEVFDRCPREPPLPYPAHGNTGQSRCFLCATESDLRAPSAGSPRK